MLDRFTRAILFVKPELVIVFDRLVAREPSTFEYWLHATRKFGVRDQRHIRVQAGEVCPEEVRRRVMDSLMAEGFTPSK